MFLLDVKQELLRHVGPNPTFTQKLLIDRAAILSLRLAQIDRKVIEETNWTVIDANQAIAWSNALTRILNALGVKKPVKARHDTILAEVAANVSG